MSDRGLVRQTQLTLDLTTACLENKNKEHSQTIADDDDAGLGMLGPEDDNGKYEPSNERLFTRQAPRRACSRTIIVNATIYRGLPSSIVPSV